MTLKIVMPPSALNSQYAGSNVTGDKGLIAIDEVGNKVRFYDPRTIAEIAVLDAPEKTVHELTFSSDRRFAFAPLYGDGIEARDEIDVRPSEPSMIRSDSRPAPMPRGSHGSARESIRRGTLPTWPRPWSAFLLRL